MRLSVLLFLPSLGLASHASAQAPAYSITRIGLVGPENTGPNGERQTNPHLVNEASFAAGTSQRFSPTFQSNGTDAWLWDGQQTMHIGFTTAAHTASDGYRTSIPQLINSTGRVAGYSELYRTINFQRRRVGQSAWIAGPLGTQQVGLIGPGYENEFGMSDNVVRQLNDEGFVLGEAVRLAGTQPWIWHDGAVQAIGLANAIHFDASGSTFCTVRSMNGNGRVSGVVVRFVNNSNAGTDAWLWNGSSTTAIGPEGLPHTSPAGVRRVRPVLSMRADDAVLGQAARFSSSAADLGEDAWISMAGVTTILGLLDGEHQRSDGYRYTTISVRTESGFVGGSTNRFGTDGAALGTDAWLWRDGIYQVLGLIGPGFQNLVGSRSGSVGLVSESGFAAGTSTLYGVSGNANGSAAWVWDGVATQRAGLVTPAHTGASGRQRSSPQFLTRDGGVYGDSDRFIGENINNGRDIWYFGGSTTQQIGLFGGVFLRADGFQRSDLIAVNSEGKAIGLSYAASTGAGNGPEFGWYFDPASGATYDISAVAPAVAALRVRAISNDGYAVGNYSVQSDNIVRAFMYRPDIGFHPLESLVEGGLGSNGWSNLIEPSTFGLLPTAGVIIGRGNVIPSEPGYAGFVLQRLPGCPSDFNLDGELNPDDLGDFINCYFAVPTCSRADFNGDSNVDADDLADFINAYFAGCP